MNLCHFVFLLIAVLTTPALSHSIELDIGKLTDFTTDFSGRASADRTSHVGLGWFADMKDTDFRILRSTMSLNVADKTLDMKMKFKTNLQGPIGSGADVRIVFDGSIGYAAVEVSGRVGQPPAGVKACVKTSFPPQMLPPSQVIQHQIQGVGPRANAIVNGAPHAEFKYEGQDLEIFMGCVGCHPPSFSGPHGDVGFAIENDGTPFGLFSSTNLMSDNAGMLVRNIQEYHGKPIIRFDHWVKGAPKIPEVVCAAGKSSAQEVLAQEEVQQALFIAEQLLSSFQRQEALQLLHGNIFAQVPELLRSAAGENPNINTADTGVKFDAGQAQPTLVVAVCGVIAGAVGGMFAFIILSKASPKDRRVSLFSDEA